jgi:hypothetical protein
MKYIKLFETYSEIYDDEILTKFRRSLNGYGGLDDLKDTYSFSNEDDIDEIFSIIENIIFTAMVSQKMDEYENKTDIKLNNRIDKYIKFIKSEKGLSFENGGFKLNGISKKDVVYDYINQLY